MYDVSKKDTLKPVADVKQIAKKKGVSINKVKSAVKQGIGIEKEHTKDTATARQIALAHVGEKPNYYTKLKKYVESRNPLMLSKKELQGYHKVVDPDSGKVTYKKLYHKKRLKVVKEDAPVNSVASGNVPSISNPNLVPVGGKVVRRKNWKRLRKELGGR